MILSAIAERLKRRSKNDFKGRHFEAPLIRACRKLWRRPNTVHFTIWITVLKSIQVVGCGARGRSG
jgi:hypothetical protein